MAETLTETEGCALLARLFKQRGYAIERNQQFREYGVEFHVDGWDPLARVGFEFLTSEDEDHDDLSLEEYKTLSAAQKRGELSLFIIDEVEPVSAADLIATANEFLDEVASAADSRRRAALRKGRPVVKRGGAKRAGTRASATKPAAKKAGGRKMGKVALGLAKRATKKSAKKPAKKPVKKTAGPKRRPRR